MRDRAMAKLSPGSSHSSGLCLFFLPAQLCQSSTSTASPGQVEAGTAAPFCGQSTHPAFSWALLLTAFNPSGRGGNALLNADFRWVALPCYTSCLFPQRHHENSFVRWPHSDSWSRSSSDRSSSDFYVCCPFNYQPSPAPSEAKCILGLF